MQTIQWINAIRPICGISTMLLVIAGFRQSHQTVDWGVVIAVFFLTSMAMLWNDYHDRDIDMAKGRPLARNHQRGFLRYTLVFVTISLWLSIVVFLRNPLFGALCLAMWITSIGYSEAQRNPIAKNLIVSLNTGATVMFPLLLDGRTPVLWLMAGTIATIISVRELMGDIRDVEVDCGKKLTLALVLGIRANKTKVTRVRFVLDVILTGLIIWGLYFI